jgi:diguanylate cyclase
MHEAETIFTAGRGEDDGMGAGPGFLFGAAGGLIFGLIAAGLFFLKSRPAKRNAAKLLRDGSAPAGGTESFPAVPKASSPTRSGRTMVVEKIGEQEQGLARAVREVRDVLLRIAAVVGGANAASDQADLAFSSARKALVGVSAGGNLKDAQEILVQEVNRLLKGNAVLKGELDKAHKGIAEQRRQIEDLRERTRIDFLTNVPNRVAFDERMHEFAAALDRTGRPFSLLMLDIDHFKKINDSLGHLGGDRILNGVAKRITDFTRANDFAARYGGEEFAVVFPGTGLAEAMQVAERLRQGIASTNFRLDDVNVKATVSGGLAEAAAGMSIESIIAAADMALYQSKRDGRNRLTAAPGEGDAAG